MKLPIPRNILQQHVIAFGKTRSGKSAKLRLIVEDKLRQGIPTCVMDPKGDWWGLRSSADGKSAGYPLVIFGTEYSRHVDVRFTWQHGAAIAELVATGNRPTLIDMKGMRVGDRNRFFAAFAESYFRHATGERCLVIDEVHNFTPKGKTFSVESAEALHWANRLAAEGAGMGITLLAASQRPQKVHNDFSSSCETLIACRVVMKHDRDAIADWVDACGDPAVAKDMLSSIAAMQRTDAWVYSPEEGFGPKQITFPMFETYDSFKPQDEKATKRLKGWADVDLAEVQGKLAAVVEEHKANDPKELKAEVARLKAELAKKPATTTVTETRSDPTQIAAARLDGQRAGFDHAMALYTGFINASNAVVERITVLDAERRALSERITDARKKLSENGPTAHPVTRAGTQRRTQQPPPVAAKRQAVAPVSGKGDGTISPSARKILEQIHGAYPMGLSYAQAAARAAISKRSSQYNAYRQQVEASGEAELRNDGRFVSLPGFSQPLPAGADPVEAFASRLPPSTAKMLRAIRDFGPLTKDDVADHAVVSRTSSGLGSGLKELIELGLIEYHDHRYQLHRDFT